MLNGMRHSFIFFKDPDYNVIIMSIFSCLNVSGGHKEDRRMVIVEVV